MGNILGEAFEARSGASKEIGTSIARHLADGGAAVVVNCAASKEGAGRVVAEIEHHGGKAIAVQASAAKQSDIERLVSETKKAFGRLHILVNDAGRWPLSGSSGPRCQGRLNGASLEGPNENACPHHQNVDPLPNR